MRSLSWPLLAAALGLAITGRVPCLAGSVEGGRAMDQRRWAERVIPLPKELSVDGSAALRADQVLCVREAPESPAVETAVGLVKAFALGRSVDAEFKVRLALAENAPKWIGADALKRLRGLPNADQAYLIAPSTRELALVANTPVGLLYAARTLSQLVNLPRKARPGTKIEMPLVRITDWPDLAERGQWGGDANRHQAAMSQWKLNVLEHDSGVGSDDQGRPTVTMKAPFVSGAAALGMKVVPFISHLEQLSRYPSIRKRTDIRSKPDPAKPLPSDYFPGLCMSSPATAEIVQGWLGKIAAIDGVTDIMVWLSEDRAPCFCEKCSGKEPFELEVKCIVGAFDEVRKAHPQARLRLLLTQGSYAVNDKVLAAVPEGVGVSYYDGGRTYDSSRRPMIYPLLERYARSGRWLGVYPQITHSWRCVFPWTGPQFVRYRAQEFADKRLQCMIGYAVPSNLFHDFNVTAMAEWTWNAHGRRAEEFCRAYALKKGISDPDLFAKWAMLAGEAGWSLAESKLFLTAIYNPSVGLGAGVPFDHRFQNASIANIEEQEKSIEAAREALALAKRFGTADTVCESECALAGLEAFGAIRSAFPLLAEKALDEAQRKALSQSLDTLDRSSTTLRGRLIEWGGRALQRPASGSLPGRLYDTAFALQITCDEFRAKAAVLGVADPRPETRFRKLREWSAQDFPVGSDVKIRTDITDIVPEQGGEWQVGLRFVESAYGTDVKAISVVSAAGGEEKVVAKTADAPARVSRYERWHEMRLDIPARASGGRLYLEVTLTGLPSDAPADRRTCSGAIGIRRIAP